MVLGVPQISVQRIVSHKLHSLNIGYQYIYPFLGHFVFGSYPGHGLGVFGLEDATEQGPVHGPRLDGFGAVGAVAVHALLADVNLPASEIGGGWVHGLGVGGWVNV